jgi:hypothetical protein
VTEPLEDLEDLIEWGSSSLARLVFPSEQGLIESLMKMRFLLGQMAQPWVDLLAEILGHPQDCPPLFPLRILDQE